jgi:Amt family ammonium transporter
MYTAKGDGKRRYAIYEPEMHARAKRRQELASALARAVEREEILVHLQPIVSLPSGRIVSFEALARWQHPEHGLLAPSNFIPLAEETGLMTAIGRIVLQQSCRRLAAWQATLAEDTTLAISVNLSPTELQNPTLVEDVDAILSEARLASQHLILEITESTAVRDPAATILRLRQLRDLGIKVALDDFGTGYSSLSHLRELPIDFIKIAKPFIDALQHAESGQTLVKAILHIAEALELDVIAEGIEHAAQAEILSRLNCGFAQGYHFSAPLDEESATALLRATVQQQWRDAQRRRRAPGPRQGETLVDVSTARG